MDGLQLRDEAVRDRIRQAEEFLDSMSKLYNERDVAADDILSPLKTNKVASAEQRAIHAQMLFALRPTNALVSKIQQGLTPVTVKEANETAASAEMQTLCKYIEYGMKTGIKIEPATTDAFSKGLAEKRLPAMHPLGGRAKRFRVEELLDFEQRCMNGRP